MATVACATALVLGAGGMSSVGAWPGDPDGAWGSCGVRPVNITANQVGEATSVLMVDGLYVVGGSIGTKGLVVRFTAGGALDATFGTGGKTTITSGADASMLALARQANGKIVAAGTRTSAGDMVDSLVVRLTTEGELDESFNDTGQVVMDLGEVDRLTGVQVQTNGGIVVGATAGSEGAVARLTSGGDPDPSFSGDGRRTGLPMTVQALALQPDGKILIGGRATNDFAIMRLNPDGSTDASFGGSDGVVADAGGYDSVTALALDGDGKVVVAGAGHGASGAGHTIVRRYHANGTRDTDFEGIDRAFGLNDTPVGVAVRGDGKIVVAGNSKVGSDNDVLVLRLDGDGTLDDTFGIGGVSLADVGARPVAGDLVVRADGRVLVVGSVPIDGVRQLALLRYQSDTAMAARPAQGYVVNGYGNLYGFSAGCATKPPRPIGNTTWPGQDVVRGIAALPGGRGLQVIGSGRLYPFRFGDGSLTGFQVAGNKLWPGQDVARGVAVVPEGTGGYVVDGTGRLYPFRIGAAAKPAVPAGMPSWPGQDVVRGVALLPNRKGGYLLQASGRLVRFGGAPAAGAGAPSWPGQDVARGVTIAPDGSGGWVVDAYGGVHPFGIGSNAKPPAAVGGPAWPGFKIARGVAALP